MNNDTQIEVRNLWKVFGPHPDRALEPEHAEKSRTEIQEELGLVTALRDVSFTVGQGQVYVVMGLSGSGKSTLARMLIRLMEPSRGNILFDGQDIMQFSQEEITQFRRTTTAMVFQNYALLPHRRVLENVAYGLEIQGVGKHERLRIAEETIETVGLGGWERYYPREMSGGMQQRVGLARALAVNPSVLIMDEPFSGLDPLIRRQMQDELVSLQSEMHKTIVFITHDLNEALKLGNRIAIMRDGEIIQEGSPEEIVSAPSDDYVSEFVRDVSTTRVVPASAVMKEPEDIIYTRQGPRAALHLMDTLKMDTLFLVSGDSKLEGLIIRREAQSLAADNRDTLDGARVVPPVSVSPDDSLEDVLQVVAESTRPVAVVGDGGALLGEIRKNDLLPDSQGAGNPGITGVKDGTH